MRWWRCEEGMKMSRRCVGGWHTHMHTNTHKERESTRIKIRARKQKLLEVPAEDYYYSPPQKGEDMNGWGGGGSEQQGGGREGGGRGGVSRVVRCLWGSQKKQVSGTNYMKKNLMYELVDRNTHKWPRRFNDMKITNIQEQLKIRKLAEVSHLYSSFSICTSEKKTHFTHHLIHELYYIDFVK